MFTGLVGALGEVVAVSVLDGSGIVCLSLKVPIDFCSPLRPGDSVAVNGACLTVVGEPTNQTIDFHVSGETLSKTQIGELRIGHKVHLEEASRLGTPMGGHLVTGHIDCTCQVETSANTPLGWDLSVNIPAQWRELVVPKGSICIDGVSLTINSLEYLSSGDVRIFLTLIPVTIEKTRLGSLEKGSVVNIEYDLVLKHIKHLVDLRLPNPS